MNKLVFIKKYIPQPILDITGEINYDVLPIGDGTAKIIGRYKHYFIDTTTFTLNIKKHDYNANFYIVDEDTNRYLTVEGFINEEKDRRLKKLIDKI